MSSKRVFILGAGFSKQAGMPLATELTPLILDRFKESGQEEALSWFEYLKQRIDWLEASKEGKLTRINIEQVFDIACYDVVTWRMEQHRCSLGRKCDDTPWNYADQIETWLTYMEDDLIDIIWDKQKSADEKKMEGIQSFVRNLRKGNVILTFNYDTLLEKSLEKSRIRWSYGFKEENPLGIRVLKMHGSINYKIAQRNTSCNDNVLFRKEDPSVSKNQDSLSNDTEWKYELAHVPDDQLEKFITLRDLGFVEKYSRVGIAGLGTHKRLEVLPGSGQIWFNARKALQEAQEIYVVGFSLSPFDNMARLQFAGVMLNRTEKNMLPPKVSIIDPSAYGLEPNFRAVFGPDTVIKTLQQTAEQTDWESLLDG